MAKPAVDASQAFDVADDLTDLGDAAPEQARRVEDVYAQRALGMIQAAAPVGTGDYASSFYIKSDEFGAEVGTDKDQGFRLEMGFHGTDITQRVISQAAQPHVGPVAEALREPFELAMGTAVVGSDTEQADAASE